MTDARTQLVAAGYDAMADVWESWKGEVGDDARASWLDELVGRLEPGARVLELGCAGGTEETRVLAERFRLTALDVSAEQARRAQRRVPAAEVRHEDFTEVEFPPESFEAVAAFYSFNHVPRDLLPGLFGRIHSWLAPGGLFLATLGATDLPDWTGEWLGVPMFFSGLPAEANRRLLAAAGFVTERDEVVTIAEPEGPVSFHWVLVRR